jgi:hypothetical protein
MTKRAMLWCGHVKPPLPPRDRYGQSIPKPTFPDCDFPASVNDLEISIQAARSLGVSRSETYAFVCSEDLLPWISAPRFTRQPSVRFRKSPLQSPGMRQAKTRFYS